MCIGSGDPTENCEKYPVVWEELPTLIIRRSKSVRVESQISGQRDIAIHCAFQKMTWRDNALTFWKLALKHHAINHHQRHQ